MKAYWQALRQMERSGWLYLAGWAMISFGYFGVQAVLLNLYLLHLGFDPAYIGSFLASGQLIWAAFGLPAGMVGARLGLRASIIAGYLLVVLGWTALLLAEALPASELGAGLMAGWMLSWVGVALISVNSLPYQMGVTTDANRGYIFSFQQAVQAACALLGGFAAGILPGLINTALGGTLNEAGSYRAVLWLMPLAHMVGLFAMLRARPVRLLSTDSPGAPVSRAPLGIFAFYAVIVLFQAAGEGGVRSFLNVYLQEGIHLPTSQIGTVFGLAQLAPLAAALIIPMLLKRMSSGGALGLSTLTMASAILILTISSTLVSAASGMFAILLISAVLATTRSMFSQEVVQPRWRPMTSALTTIFMALGWAVSSAYGGKALEQMGFHNLFRIGAALVALAALITIVYVRAAASRSRRITGYITPVPVTGETEEALETPAVAES